ncbi:MAG TPA: AmmeMemoRadiSam system protein B, partial [Bryobacteraceae bacterium]|nr:AmmeMemoRadiSam system protein B [Bryobacteraceae bacterium]
MAQPLPRLRMNLDFMPSPVEDRPGLLIRDTYGYSEAVLIIPPELVQCLACFDGEQTHLDLRQLLVRMTGQLEVGPLEQHLVETLSTSGFLHDDTYEHLREARHREFAESPTRPPIHAGTAYPEEPEDVRATLDAYLAGSEHPPVEGKLIGIAAPHVSPFGGWQTYRAAYTALPAELRDDTTFVILGTSHYGEPDRFGLTRKPFETPYG